MGPLAGAALGIGTGMAEDLWQYGIQQWQQRQQMSNTKELMRLQNAYNLENWKATGPVGQMEQLKKAGLNPALMYGMSGGAGGTMTAPNMQAPLQQAPSHNNVAAGLGLALIDAQRRNINADTKAKEVHAAKEAGVDTAAAQQGIEESKQRVEVLAQQQDNLRRQYQIMKLQEQYDTMRNWMQQETSDAQIKSLNNAAEQSAEQLRIIKADREIKEATKDELIKITEQQVQENYLRMALIKATKGKTDEEIKSIIQTRSNDFSELTRKWYEMDYKSRETAAKELIARYETDPTNDMIKNTMIILGAAAAARSLLPQQSRAPIGYKTPRDY